MAITYKSQGSGVATETSAAALSPLCPATVDAGDILIAHVMWEGTTTAPSTPGTWDLLSGPHVVGTTIFRHWLYGKIADGTEDGAAVAFGNPAVTTQRGARIYSFAGRTGGTIQELITGFAHIENANDPTFPTVSTTVTGALAVALIAQNDNNVLANSTGESGGDWVEAVAEFSANLTPGLSMGIQTCIPTGDPGTVTGGTDNTTNDPAGVLGFQIKPNVNVSVTTAVGTVTITGLAPTVTVGSNTNVTPAVGTVVIAGLAPTVSVSDNKSITTGLGTVVIEGLAPTANIGIVVSPSVGTVVIAGLAPTVSVSDNKNISTDVGAVVIAGLEPIVSVSNNINITTDIGSVVIAGLAPTVQTPRNITTSTGDVTISGLAPTVSVTNHVSVTPGIGTIVIEGLEPSVGSGLNVTPAVGQVTIVGLAPTINVTVSAEPQTGEIVITGIAPTVNVSVSSNTQTGEVVITGLAPTISISDNKNVFPGVGEVVISGLEPTISNGGELNIETNTGSIVINGLAPQVKGGRKRFLIRKSRVANDANRFSTVDHANLKSKVDDI